MALIDRTATIGPAFTRTVQKFDKHVTAPLSKAAGRTAGEVAGAVVGKGIDLINAATKVDYKAIGRSGLEKGKRGVGYTLHGLSNEAEFVGRSGSLLKKQLIGDAPISTHYFGENSKITKAMKKTALFKRDETSVLLGAKATKLGVGVIAAGSFIAGTPKAANTFVEMQKGRNDGSVRTNTPVNNYAQTGQMGHSYANNAGATGDLVFALHNQRHTGIL